MTVDDVRWCGTSYSLFVHRREDAGGIRSSALQKICRVSVTSTDGFEHLVFVVHGTGYAYKSNGAAFQFLQQAAHTEWVTFDSQACYVSTLSLSILHRRDIRERDVNMQEYTHALRSMRLNHVSASEYKLNTVGLRVLILLIVRNGPRCSTSTLAFNHRVIETSGVPSFHISIYMRFEAGSQPCEYQDISLICRYVMDGLLESTLKRPSGAATILPHSRRKCSILSYMRQNHWLSSN